ncbi:serine protease Do [Primorskyibacter sedentarius]|uniref:Probable periplasmic serine endoprotease DegP-like n=1 Tax=Primorskyibacter sedentarius TaxID=745311 RepID=A0A4R3IXQ9_9RHOB|nr:trypsin-like peptidase domain-containing protein [Primorskyibacter sedentarius]TCS54482.1 serine protease Do [Primorskyibacter sedentarius]
MNTIKKIIGTAAVTAITIPSLALAAPAGGYGDLVETVSPSVVFIEVTGAGGSRVGPASKESSPNGLGSGFIISADGDIVTNHHVVNGAASVVVKLADGRSFDAEVVGSDPMTDIALLKILSDEDLPVVAFGASEEMRAGDEVFAVGNPFGLGNTVTSGIISAMSRNINSGPYDDFIQTDAAINRGNSGGPLFNDHGEVIGVNTMIYSPDGGSVGIGFAVPSDLAQTIVTDLEDDGTISRGWLGVQIKPMSQEIADVLGYDAPKGAMIEMVTADSPAATAGLQIGDIILSFAGTEINEMRDLTRAVANTSPDETAEVVVLHKGSEVTMDVQIGLLQPSEA